MKASLVALHMRDAAAVVIAVEPVGGASVTSRLQHREWTALTRSPDSKMHCLLWTNGPGYNMTCAGSHNCGELLPHTWQHG
jgi:hypothetical protein